MCKHTRLAVECGFALVFATTASAQQECSLTVVAEGVRSVTGRVGFMLFDSKDGWPKDFKQAFRRGGLAAQVGDVEWVFEDLPPGQYAVITVHDENENRKLDRNVIGKPKEGWRMSNNPKAKLSAPRFSAAAFHLGCPGRISIKLRY